MTGEVELMRCPWWSGLDLLTLSSSQFGAKRSIRQRRKATLAIWSIAIGRAERGRARHAQFRHPVTSGTLCSLSGLRVT